jgi:membrane-bound serine protease (ClpP class)
MTGWLYLGALLSVVGTIAGAGETPTAATSQRKAVYVLPIRDDIMPPLVYLVRRGVKEAMEAGAETLVLDMDTHGGRVDVTEEIISIVGQFKGHTVTYVNKKAFSAGAFISFATQKIYMSPQSVIGAAAPIMMAPGGSGVEAMPDTLEVKTVSAISALVRANAEKNGHNVEVADAMVKKTKELKVDGKVLNEKGQILTLTNREAEQEYGTPPKALLSAGTVETLDALLTKLGYSSAQRVDVHATGAEKLGTWINSLSPLLLILGIAGLYIEFKTPGFGIFGIVGILAFALYFFGGYVAGMSGLEWMIAFVIGLVLFALELFAFPGSMLCGISGAALMLAAIIMAMVDKYPGMPALPTLPQLALPLTNLAIAMAGAIAVLAVLSRVLPKTSIYSSLVSHGASGVKSVETIQRQQSEEIGQIGVTISILRPGGKAQFDNRILDVISQGEMIEKGKRVRIVAHSGREAVVEVVA